MAEKTGNGDDRLMGWLRIAGWGGAAALLLGPAIAMQVTHEVAWTAADFVFAAVVLGGVGLGCELVARASRSWWYRGGGWTALAATLGLIWVNAAVGIIGEPIGANALFAVVVAIALIGGVLAGFKPRGSAAAMIAAGMAQLAIGGAALIAGWGANSPGYPLDILGCTVGFAALWFASAWMFRMAEKPGGVGGR